MSAAMKPGCCWRIHKHRHRNTPRSELLATQWRLVELDVHQTFGHQTTQIVVVVHAWRRQHIAIVLAETTQRLLTGQAQQQGHGEHAATALVLFSGIADVTIAESGWREVEPQLD